MSPEELREAAGRLVTARIGQGLPPRICDIGALVLVAGAIVESTGPAVLPGKKQKSAQGRPTRALSKEATGGVHNNTDLRA